MIELIYFRKGHNKGYWTSPVYSSVFDLMFEGTFCEGCCLVFWSLIFAALSGKFLYGIEAGRIMSSLDIKRAETEFIDQIKQYNC